MRGSGSGGSSGSGSASGSSNSFSVSWRSGRRFAPFTGRRRRSISPAMRSARGTGWSMTPSSSSSSTASTVWDMMSFSATRSGAADSYTGSRTSSGVVSSSGSEAGSGSGTGSGTGTGAVGAASVVSGSGAG